MSRGIVSLRRQFRSGNRSSLTLSVNPTPDLPRRAFEEGKLVPQQDQLVGLPEQAKRQFGLAEDASDRPAAPIDRLRDRVSIGPSRWDSPAVQIQWLG
ncbi:hypothetical protein MJC1_01355 [Methylocystis sp. MJC1]|nr:hypothetical protein MJC1_01355 [Methylocystis sp. MJC1]